MTRLNKSAVWFKELTWRDLDVYHSGYENDYDHADTPQETITCGKFYYDYNELMGIVWDRLKAEGRKY
jgi:hypothetical protein